jgi:NADPH:quinone reductase-like Zn-dependent oxidoreductase
MARRDETNRGAQPQESVMKAVRIHEYGGPEKLSYEEDVPEPEMTADGVLIEVAACSVNPIDWKVRSGARQTDFPLQLPAILGKDVSGIVLRVGASVRHFKAGDRVFALGNATYAERVVVESSTLAHVPDGVDLNDAAAIPLIAVTGDQLVRGTTQVRAGQTILVSGALGSVGRAAVHSAMKIGARVIAGVRKAALDEAAALQTSGSVAIDDEQSIAGLPMLDGVADTVGGEIALKLLAKVKAGGNFGYASVLPGNAAEINPTVKISRVFGRPDASKIREFADDVRDGRFVLPIGRRLQLRDAVEAHRLGEKGGVGKILMRP